MRVSDDRFQAESGWNFHDASGWLLKKAKIKFMINLNMREPKGQQNILPLNCPTLGELLEFVIPKMA